MPLRAVSIILFAVCATPQFLYAQTAQVGAKRGTESTGRIRVDYVHYRPARWEAEKVKEFESEIVNKGGLVYVYFTNISEKPVNLHFWRLNGNDESYWRLNHFVAWDRCSNEHPEPGTMRVLEINGTTEDFAEGKPFDFSYVDRDGRAATSYTGELHVDPVSVSFIRVMPDLRNFDVYVRNSSGTPFGLGAVEAVGKPTESVEWTTNSLATKGHAIARVTLAETLPSAQPLIVRITIKKGEEERAIYAHRRAFPDEFPIGTWSANEKTWDTLHRMHIDTVVEGGPKDKPFFTEATPKYGFRAMVHTGQPVNPDYIRELSGHPSVICWMLQDEPDWSIPANIMEYCDRTVRMYDSTRPTFITLCRNIKFFEYAPIPDIACQDHYSVTAPSSSLWPRFYGTRLEETAYYTRDLKMAAEPKPIWIWSQGMANWGERPKRPVPTREELAAQLVLNLGRGAKGILWFNYDQELADKYPDVRQAMQQWGRVMRVLRGDFLGSDPALLEARAPDKVDVAPLLGWDKLILCVTNTDYEIHPEAYPFVDKENVVLDVALPEWLHPQAVLRIAPEGISSLPFTTENSRASIQFGHLHDAGIAVLCNDPCTETSYRTLYEQALTDE